MKKRVLEMPDLCTGCSACICACAKDAISLREDPEQQYGYTAWIDPEKCVDCGKCRQVCPVCSPAATEQKEDPSCYALYAAPDILEKSASGGAFTLLAETILEEGGLVIGASYGNDFRVNHTAVERTEELDSLRRSKYVQSDVSGAYTIIKNTSEDRPVLFTGTPCQVAGIKRIFPTRKNLYCVDLYCGHTPSYHLFKQYLSEKTDIENISSYDFRTKQEGWKSEIATITCKDGSQILCHTQDDDYQLGYHSRLMMRRVCEQCRFSGRPRQGDISIADYWWIENSYPDLKNKMGTSAVLVNTKKGEGLFRKASEKAALCRKTELDSMKDNRPEHVEAHPSRDRFYRLLEEGSSFSQAVQKAFHHKYDVVLWGNWSEKNYGSELTYYALYQVLRRKSLDVLLVERPREAVWGPNDSPVLFKENPYPAGSCYVPDSKRDMYELKYCSDTFMVGSDQIWHHDLYDCFGRVCYLDFIHGNVKKIAFASSFGRDYWTGNDADAARRSLELQEFEYVSVREDSGVEICRERFGIQARRVLDPVFLCPSEYYRALAEKSALGDKRHIAVYMLDESARKQEWIRMAEEKLGVGAFVISDAFIQNVEEGWDREIFSNASLEDWLCNIITADYVLTDSFHGTCLAIIFNKPFISIVNHGRGENRFRELLGILGLKDRLLAPDAELETLERLLSEPVCFDEVNAILEREKELSRDWLDHALESRITRPYDRAVLTEEHVDEMNIGFAADIRELAKIRDWHTQRLDYHDQIEKWHTDRLDYRDKISDWHTERLDNQDKIAGWHTERLDNQDKIANWHTERLDAQEKTIREMQKQIEMLKGTIQDMRSKKGSFLNITRKT
jgi:coenzyme F420-reducing hydrogenase beta subunit